MAFQVRCPACSKLYAAEERMIGRKMRCKACASVFAIEAPAQEPSLSAASMAGAESTTLSASDLTGTRRAEQVPPAPPPSSEEDDAPMAAETPLRKPSIPQDFPGALVVEAWLPLGLGVIAAGWVISQTFGANNTGLGWIPVLRIGVVALLYLALVVPLTYKAVTVSFRGMRRLLPPSPGMRTAMTFALPAAFGYEMWQASGGAIGFFMGLMLGLALMAVAYWLLFRLNPQEAANSYAKVAGTFLAGCAVSALILVGANAVLNKAMVSEHGGSLLKESPLGEPLAWNWQEPEAAPVKPSRQVATPEQPEAVPQPKPSAPVKTQIAQSTEPSTPVAVVPETKVQENVVEPVVNPPKQEKPSVFVNPDDDSFTDSIRKNNFAWVKSVSRPDGQMPFDWMVGASGQSMFVGLVKSDGAKGRTVTLAPGNAAVPPFQDDLNEDATFGARYVLTNDGKALLHLKNDQMVEVIATGDNRPHVMIPLEVPHSTVQLKPTLVGTSKGTTFVVRWADPQATEQYVYRYDYMSKAKLSKATIPKDPYTTPAVCAVSESESSPILYAWLSQFPGHPPTVKIVNLQTSAASMTPRTATFPVDVGDVTQFERGEMAFSPDASMVALVLEQGNTARVLAWPTGNPVNSPGVRVMCKCPSATEMAGHVRGPSVRWINRAFFVVYGRYVVGAVKHGIVGNLSDTDTIITGEQTTPDNKLYISYMLNSHLNLAAIEFDPHELNNAQVVQGASH